MEHSSLNDFDVSQKQIKIGLQNESTFMRIFFKLLKYLFIFLNFSALLASGWSLFGPNEIIVWKYDNSLLILGLMFFMVLCFVALYGSLKEECYLILTYDLFITAIYLVSFINEWRPLMELLCFGFYIALSFLLSYLVYLRNPVIVN